MTDLNKYPKTDKFKVINNIGIPHPFCITHEHVSWLADNHGGILDSSTMQNYEKAHHGACHCGVKDCNLSWAKHETALLIEVNDPRELRKYLLKCKTQCKMDKFAGFAFVRKKEAA